jgi:uncharacterized protein
VRIPDNNLLIYACDEGSPHHVESRRWLERWLSGGETVGFAIASLLGFVRIATNPQVNQPPLSPAEAFDQVEEWLAQTPAKVIQPGPRHVALCRDLLVAAGTAANLTSDAHLAALAIEHGATLTSFDSDFHRFPGLKFEFLR